MSKTPPPTLITMTLIVVTRVLEKLKESLEDVQLPVPDEEPYRHDPLRNHPVKTDIPDPVGERHKRVIPQDVKIAVSARDGGRCRKCGSTQQLHFDHVIPASKGGANTVANIQLLCGACNRAKGARLLLLRRRGVLVPSVWRGQPDGGETGHRCATSSRVGPAATARLPARARTG